MTAMPELDALVAIMRSPIGEAIGNALLQFLWQGTLIGALAAVALAALRRSAADVRYVVATIALSLMLTVPVVTAVQSIAAARQSAPVARAEPARPATAIDSSRDDRRTPIAASATGNASAPARVGGSFPEARLRSLAPWLLVGWTLGVIVLTLRLLTGWLWVQRLKTRGAVPARAAFRDVAERLARRLHLSRAVRLVESALVDVPTVIGWLKPVILIPAGALAGLGPVQIEAILAHELAHIRRHDYLVNLLQTLVETLLFYHPAVWWVSKQIRTERENCCDDLAVTLCGDPIVYAQALADLEQRRGSTGRFAMAATGGSLLHRVRRLLGAPSHAGRAPGWLAGAVAVALIVTVAGMAAGAIASDGPRRIPAEERLSPVAAARVVTSHFREAGQHVREGSREIREAQRDVQEHLRDVERHLRQAAREVQDAFRDLRREAHRQFRQIPPPPPLPPLPPDVDSMPEPPEPPEAPEAPEAPEPPELPSLPEHSVYAFAPPPPPDAPMPPGVPMPPDLPVPPAPPAAPEPPAWGGQSRQSSRQRSGTYTWSHDGEKLQVEYRGDVEFTDDDTDVKSLSPGGLLRLEDGEGRNARAVEFRADASGAVNRRFWVGSSERPFEPEGRVWLSRVLPRFVRQSAIGAPARVARIYRAKGAQGVLAEVALLEGSWAKRIYLSELLKTPGLDSRAVQQALAQAGREIDSDFELASLLIGTDRVLQDEGTRKGWFDAARTIESDFEMRRTFSAALKRGPLSPALLAGMLDTAAAIGSDFEQASLLIDVLRAQPLDDATRPSFFKALDTVGSDFERRRVLSAFVKRADLPPAAIAPVLESAAAISSDFELASLLVDVVKGRSIEGTLRNPFFRALASLESSFERGRVLRAAAARSDLSDETVLEIINGTRGMGNFETAQVLVAVASSRPLTRSTRDAYMDAASRLGDFEEGRALTALARQERRQ
jgi:beta-lactamase regulating signal transducer with metallopeptidase domain